MDWEDLAPSLLVEDDESMEETEDADDDMDDEDEDVADGDVQDAEEEIVLDGDGGTLNAVVEDKDDDEEFLR
jgi:hypothetical protein